MDEWWSQGSRGFLGEPLFVGYLGGAGREFWNIWRTIGRSSNKVAMVCLPLGIALNIGAVLIPLGGWVQGMLDTYAAPVLSAGYAAALMVSLQQAAWRRRLMPFAAVGRMALTNYLAQSVVCVAFFRLTHLYGVWGPAWDLLPTVVLFGIQVWFSNWWLGRYRFGPMEWLWRGLTYGALPRLQ